MLRLLLNQIKDFKNKKYLFKMWKNLIIIKKKLLIMNMLNILPLPVVVDEGSSSRWDFSESDHFLFSSTHFHVAILSKLMRFVSEQGKILKSITLNSILLFKYWSFLICQISFIINYHFLVISLCLEVKH